MIILGNAKVAAAGLVLTAIIFAVLYFTVIKPTTDTANEAVREGTRQSKQALDEAQRRTGGAVPARAQKLTNCLAAAGASPEKLQACQAKYGR